MNVVRLCCIWFLGLLLLAVAGCDGNRQGASRYDEIMASKLGLQIGFGIDQTAVNEKLGAASVIEELPGNIREHYYYDLTDRTKDPDTPQLQLTYQDDKLIRIYNRYRPDSPDAPLAPHFVELLSGIKLGNRKSDVVAALGPPNNEQLGMEWRFTGEEGGLIVVRTGFTELSTGGIETDKLLTMLYVSCTNAVGGPVGEIEENKVDWRDLAKDKTEDS